MESNLVSAAEDAAAFILKDAPRGTSLAGFVHDAHARLCTRLEKLTDADFTLTIEEAGQLRRSLDTLIEAKRVLQESGEKGAAA